MCTSLIFNAVLDNFHIKAKPYYLLHHWGRLWHSRNARKPRLRYPPFTNASLPITAYLEPSP